MGCADVQPGRAGDLAGAHGTAFFGQESEDCEGFQHRAPARRPSRTGHLTSIETEFNAADGRLMRRSHDFMFDVFLPIIVLAPAGIHFQPPTTPPEVAALVMMIASTTLPRRS